MLEDYYQCVAIKRRSYFVRQIISVQKYVNIGIDNDIGISREKIQTNKDFDLKNKCQKTVVTNATVFCMNLYFSSFINK